MNRLPTFPTSGKHITHCRAALALLLEGRRVDQFVYHLRTGLPLVDFRTRISNLTLKNGWPIEREFHLTLDFNGEPRRVMSYWLDPDLMAACFAANPAFKTRCEKFRQQWGESLCRSQLKQSPAPVVTGDEASFQTKHLNDSRKSLPDAIDKALAD